ncbi:MAG: TerC family protein [Anaerolineales bacterium]|nr:TerC family protein [Anaerolineales bacterium]
MDWLTDPQVWIALLTLTSLEVVLGIDNVIFISILAGKLPADQQPRARQAGLALALVTRILLLLSISWIISLETNLLPETWPIDLSGHDLILLGGGLFLLAKSTREIHERLEGETGHSSAKAGASFTGVIVQIMLLDIVFSLDSVITAVGMADEIWVMIAAVVIAVVIMLAFAGRISDFVNKHPTVKMLALSFLLLIGTTLIIEALHLHIPKGYIYFAMGFSVFVELLNIRAHRAKTPVVQLHEPYVAAGAGGAPAVVVSAPRKEIRPVSKNKKKGKR